jgi:hypothetical protein
VEASAEVVPAIARFCEITGIRASRLTGKAEAALQRSRNGELVSEVAGGFGDRMLGGEQLPRDPRGLVL